MTKMFDNKYRYLNDDEKGMRCPSDCGCIGGCRIYSGIYPYPVKVALVTLYEITEDDGDKYFFADRSEELSEALEATGDQADTPISCLRCSRPFALMRMKKLTSARGCAVSDAARQPAAAARRRRFI